MSKADDNYKLLRTQLDERLKADKRLAAIADKIAKGKANFADTAKYTQIVSQHMGKIIFENIGKITVPLGKEAVCKELLRDHYDLINGVFGKVQVSVDEKMGIHIKPVKPAYPTERVDTWAHSLEDPKVEQSVIERRGQSGAENIGNSMHDDCVKENAKLHDKAGLDTYLVRDAGGGCCAWCAALAGRYKYADAPDDVFRRHDHCTCTTTYECGRMRQDVWSKRTWQASDKELEQRKALSETSKPTVNTPEQAKELERQALEKNPVTKLSPEQAQELNERNKPNVYTKEQAAELENRMLNGNENFQNDIDTAEKPIEESKYKFVEAKTIEEAEQFALANGIRHVDYSDLPLETANLFNRAAMTLPEDIRPAYIGSGRNIQKAVGVKFSRTEKQYYGVHIDALEMHFGEYPNIEHDFEGGHCVGISSAYKTPEKITKSKIDGNIAYAAKHDGHTQFFNTDGNSTAFHEMGHIYADEKGIPEGFAEDAQRWYQESNCDMLKSVDEAWAEAWGAYHTENPDLPEYISKYISDATSNSLTQSSSSGIIESTVQFDGKIYKKSSSDFRTVRLEKREYKHLMSEIASNLSEEQNASNVFIKYCGNYQYIVENRGFGNYRVISRRKIK